MSSDETSKILFRINEDGVTEWVVGVNKGQALEFYTHLVGEDTIQEAYKEYVHDIPGATFDEFINYYIKEESPENSFTLIRDNGERVTKTVGEFLTGVGVVPFYFACNDY